MNLGTRKLMEGDSFRVSKHHGKKDYTVHTDNAHAFLT
jgi:hypothetical protein